MAGELKIKVQIYCGNEIALGPGKADLLQAIAEQGSISAAGRSLGMSYRRAWLLVDTMNRCWREPLVATMPGGSARHGAQLTDAGRRALTLYRALQAEAGAAGRGEAWAGLAAELRAEPERRRAS